MEKTGSVQGTLDVFGPVWYGSPSSVACFPTHLVSSFFSELSVLGDLCTAVALTGQNGFLITGLNSSKTDKQRVGYFRTS